MPEKQNRSGEELAMRALIVPELRKRWPSARIVHELPLRYSTNRIDLAAITETEIIGVEIKSSKDVADRLEKQLRGFLPICRRVIVALAPKWNEKLPAIEKPVRRRGVSYTSRVPQETAAQAAISRVGRYQIETWTVDADAGSIEITESGHDAAFPWTGRMLDVLHVAELCTIAERHRCLSIGKRPPRHQTLVRACHDLMTGREIIGAVCRALRARPVFGAASDPPIVVDDKTAHRALRPAQEAML